PGRTCEATVAATQGRRRAKATLPGAQLADIAVAQGGVVLTGRESAAKEGDAICKGEDPQTVVHDSLRRSGLGLAAGRGITLAQAAANYWFIRSRPRGAAGIEYHGLIRAHRLTVQMPDGDTPLDVFPPPFHASTGSCTAPPASVFAAPVTQRECWE